MRFFVVPVNYLTDGLFSVHGTTLCNKAPLYAYPAKVLDPKAECLEVDLTIPFTSCDMFPKSSVWFARRLYIHGNYSNIKFITRRYVRPGRGILESFVYDGGESSLRRIEAQVGDGVFPLALFVGNPYSTGDMVVALCKSVNYDFKS